MTDYATGFRWRLSEYDDTGQILAENIYINQWSKDLDRICLYDDRGICESEIMMSGILDLGRHEFNGISITSKGKKTFLVNDGDRESGGLLLDLLTILIEPINIDKMINNADKNRIEDHCENINPCAKLLMTYLRIIA
jgi:hypothetical protein